MVGEIQLKQCVVFSFHKGKTKEGIQHPRAASEHVLLYFLLGHHPKKILLKKSCWKEEGYFIEVDSVSKEIGMSKIYVGLVQSVFICK